MGAGAGACCCTSRVCFTWTPLCEAGSGGQGKMTAKVTLHGVTGPAADEINGVEFTLVADPDNLCQFGWQGTIDGQDSFINLTISGVAPSMTATWTCEFGSGGAIGTVVFSAPVYTCCDFTSFQNTAGRSDDIPDDVGTRDSFTNGAGYNFSAATITPELRGTDWDYEDYEPTGDWFLHEGNLYCADDGHITWAVPTVGDAFDPDVPVNQRVFGSITFNAPDQSARVYFSGDDDFSPDKNYLGITIAADTYTITMSGVDSFTSGTDDDHPQNNFIYEETHGGGDGPFSGVTSSEVTVDYCASYTPGVGAHGLVQNTPYLSNVGIAQTQVQDDDGTPGHRVRFQASGATPSDPVIFVGATLKSSRSPRWFLEHENGMWKWLDFTIAGVAFDPDNPISLDNHWPETVINDTFQINQVEACAYERTLTFTKRDLIAGEVTTWTSGSEGVITAPGHGLMAGDTIDLFWATPGERHAIDVDSVVGDDITVSGGSGDNLPSMGTDVYLNDSTDAGTTVTGTIVLSLAESAPIAGDTTLTCSISADFDPPLGSANWPDEVSASIPEGMHACSSALTRSEPTPDTSVDGDLVFSSASAVVTLPTDEAAKHGAIQCTACSKAVNCDTDSAPVAPYTDPQCAACIECPTILGITGEEMLIDVEEGPDVYLGTWPVYRRASAIEGTACDGLGDRGCLWDRSIYPTASGAVTASANVVNLTTFLGQFYKHDVVDLFWCIDDTWYFCCEVEITDVDYDDDLYTLDLPMGCTLPPEGNEVSFYHHGALTGPEGSCNDWFCNPVAICAGLAADHMIDPAPYLQTDPALREDQCCIMVTMFFGTNCGAANTADYVMAWRTESDDLGDAEFFAGYVDTDPPPEWEDLDFIIPLKPVEAADATVYNYCDAVPATGQAAGVDCAEMCGETPGDGYTRSQIPTVRLRSGARRL